MTYEFIGRTIRVPSGAVESILEGDAPRDQIRTASGWWHAEDVVVVPPPGPDGDMDAWLNGPDYELRPRATFLSETTRCASGGRCACIHCYVVTTVNIATHTTISSQHWRDSQACSCLTKGCPCAR